MYKEKDIAYEQGKYWVLKEVNCYKVFKTGITHSTRVAVCGFEGQKGLEWCINEIARRIDKDNGHST